VDITRPVRRLAHFEKIALEPGESRTVRFAIDPRRDLSFPDESGRLGLDHGDGADTLCAQLSRTVVCWQQ
jgi:beta-glucosidase